ncbi:MAG: 7-cyano-7-deazaguanine synthase [Rhodothermales bacterium]|jgi:7-cyano-7-deazaguanine synthase
MNAAKKAIVLVSGGLDSSTALAIARDAGFAISALTFDYGQRHAVELEAAERVIAANSIVDHQLISLPPAVFAGSALTSAVAVPKAESIESMGEGIPVTYVPARNTLFLSYALAYAEVIGAQDIFIGVNALDYSGYPDCRPEFVAAFEAMANLATKAAVEGARLQIHAPLIMLSKAEIIQRGIALGVDYGLTHSCYDPAPSGAACAECDSCLLRAKGFAGAGVSDPTVYV